VLPPEHLPSHAEGLRPEASICASGVATCREEGRRGLGAQTLVSTIQFEDKNFLQSELCYKFAKKQHNIFYQKSDHVLLILFKLIKINYIL